MFLAHGGRQRGLDLQVIFLRKGLLNGTVEATLSPPDRVRASYIPVRCDVAHFVQKCTVITMTVKQGAIAAACTLTAVRTEGDRKQTVWNKIRVSRMCVRSARRAEVLTQREHLSRFLYCLYNRSSSYIWRCSAIARRQSPVSVARAGRVVGRVDQAAARSPRTQRRDFLHVRLLLLPLLVLVLL